MSRELTEDEVMRRARRWSRPICADRPAGRDIRGGPEYEALTEELRKLQAVDRQEPDWGWVLDTCSDLLRAETKDLQLLGALCAALLHEQGFAGLASGLTAYCQVVEELWEELSPPQRLPRRRARDANWMFITLGRMMDERFTRFPDWEALRLSHQAITRLTDLLSHPGRLGTHPLRFYEPARLLNFFRGALNRPPPELEPEPEPEPTPTPTLHLPSLELAGEALAGIHELVNGMLMPVETRERLADLLRQLDRALDEIQTGPL